MPVKWDDLHSGYFFQTLDETAAAILNRETGEVYVRCEMTGDDEWPEDVDGSDKYQLLPDKRELDLGVRPVMRFARDEAPEHLDEIEEIFSRKGAYGRFKDFLRRRGLLDKWHAYEDAAEEKALRQWCADNEIELEGWRRAGGRPPARCDQ